MPPAEEKIKVLVVDDSSFMRRAIRGMIEDDPAIMVVDVARDGREAVEKTLKLRPDVITMDVEMPVMDGLTALKTIMEKCPTPVLMLSSLTVAGAKATFDAFELGALDFIPKHLDDFSFNIFKIQQMVTDKIKAVAKKRVSRRVVTVKPVHIEDRTIGAAMGAKFAARHMGIVAIGASTGGPKAVQDVIRAMPADMPVAFIVVQHMPHNFTGPYAERLNQLSKLTVKEAQEGDVLKNGTVLVAPGGTQMRIVKKGALEARIHLENTPADALYKPCVDISFLSVAESYPGRALGVIMTGMGSDGAKGMRAIKDTGGKTLVQDEASCVVYGMPKAVVDANIQDKIAPLEQLAGEIINMV